MRRRLALLVALSSVTCACTQDRDLGPSSLSRHVEDSGVDRTLWFDGKDDYVTTGTARFPDGRAQQTLSASFSLDSTSGKQALITLRKDFDSGLELGFQDGVPTAWRVYGTRVLLTATDALPIGTWHRLAYTFDGTTNQLYLDDVLVATSEDAPDKRTPTTCWLGTLDGTVDLLHGHMDDVLVLDGLITPEGEPDLLLDLTFDESSGSTAYDRSPLANDAQLGDGIVQRMPTRQLK